MLKLKTLKIKGFRRFVKEQTIDFSSLGTLSEIKGVHKNTGGSSGAGKSSILMAIDYLFGVNEVSANLLQSNLSKDTIEVEGEFDFDSTPLTINRSKKNGLVIKTKDETFSGSSKLSEEKLDSIIGMERDIFRKTYHKRQEEGGFFLDFTPKMMYEFLSKVLNLNEWTSKTPEIELKLKDKTTDLNSSMSFKSSIESAISDYDKTLSQLTPPAIVDFSVTKASLNICKTSILNKISSAEKELKNEINSIIFPVKPQKTIAMNLDSFSEKIKLVKEQIETEKTSHFTSLNKMREAKKSLEKNISLAKKKKERVSSLQLEIPSLETQRKHLIDMKCPTCSQIWIGEELKEKIKEVENVIQNNKHEISLLPSIETQEKADEDSLERLSLILNAKEQADVAISLNIELNKLIEEKNKEDNKRNNEEREIEHRHIQEMLRLTNKKMEIDNEFSNKINELKNELKNIEKEISEQMMLEQKQEGEVASFLSRKNTIEEMKVTSFEKLRDITGKINLLNKEILVLEEAKRFIKSYVTKVFQDALEQIGTRASSILSHIPNMSNATIYFETAKETKDGRVKEEVSGIINVDGDNEFNIKTLSGGERTAIDLAVDLAVIDFIESKANKGIDLFALDEGFVGLGSAESTPLIDLLRNMDSNKKIVIIDHNPEIKEFIENGITVTRDGNESEITQE